MWCEAEMREIPDVQPNEAAQAAGDQSRIRSRGNQLRSEINARNLDRAALFTHQQTQSSTPGVIYSPVGQMHGNFIDASYRAILANPEWRRRLRKPHSAKRQAKPTGEEELTRAWWELDCASSSDALLMNIFCYPRILTTPALPMLLGIPRGVAACFGVHARLVSDGLVDRTELDLCLGSLNEQPLLIEAKLTEPDFYTAPIRLLERYRGLGTLVDLESLLVPGTDRVRGYQLLRGALAAHQYGARFCVIADARRADLVEAWLGVVACVRDASLRTRLGYLTWQEIAAVVPTQLRSFLAKKYGILHV